MYDKKLREYKVKQRDITIQIEEHSTADENHYLTAGKLLDICKRAKTIFDNSEPNEKRQFLNFVFQNCRLRGKEPIFTPKPVFAGIVSAHNLLNGSPFWKNSEHFLKKIATLNFDALRGGGFAATYDVPAAVLSAEASAKEDGGGKQCFKNPPPQDILGPNRRPARHSFSEGWESGGKVLGAAVQ